jgi:hypothetical protein
MSPPLPAPDPDHVPWYMWALGAMSTAAGWLAAKLVGRFWRQADNNGEHLREDINKVNDRLAAHGERITHLESGAVTQDYVHDVVSGVTRDFHRDHGRLESTLVQRIVESEKRTTGRVTDTVAACNNALRNEMRLLSESSDKRFDAIADLLRDLLKIVTAQRATQRKDD